jgi:hypothetical protein
MNKQDFFKALKGVNPIVFLFKQEDGAIKKFFSLERTNSYFECKGVLISEDFSERYIFLELTELTKDFEVLGSLVDYQIINLKKVDLLTHEKSNINSIFLIEKPRKVIYKKKRGSEQIFTTDEEFKSKRDFDEAFKDYFFEDWLN